MFSSKYFCIFMVNSMKWILYYTRIIKYKIWSDHTISVSLAFRGDGYHEFSEGKISFKKIWLFSLSLFPVITNLVSSSFLQRTQIVSYNLQDCLSYLMSLKKKHNNNPEDLGNFSLQASLRRQKGMISKQESCFLLFQGSGAVY